MELIFQNMLVMAGVLVVLGLLRTASTRPAKRDPKTGELVLQCASGLVYGLGFFAAGGPLFMGVLSFVIPFKFPAQVFVPIAIGAFFLVLAGGMCLWAAKRRTRVGPKGLASEYALLKPRFLRWEEVTKVSFDSGLEFWVHGKSHKAMLHVWFVGLREAVPLLREHLPEAVAKKYAPVIDRLAMQVGA